MHVTGFWGDGGLELRARQNSGFGAKKVMLLEHGDRTRGQEEGPWGSEHWLYTKELGEVKTTGRPPEGL